MSECTKCAGCGQIANDDEGTPWKYWMELPLESAVAVRMGLVKPIPCPECAASPHTPKEQESDPNDTR